MEDFVQNQARDCLGGQKDKGPKFGISVSYSEQLGGEQVNLRSRCFF